MSIKFYRQIWLYFFPGYKRILLLSNKQASKFLEISVTAHIHPVEFNYNRHEALTFGNHFSICCMALQTIFVFRSIACAKWGSISQQACCPIRLDILDMYKCYLHWPTTCICMRWQEGVNLQKHWTSLHLTSHLITDNFVFENGMDGMLVKLFRIRTVM